jgi:hypothetical protein
LINGLKWLEKEGIDFFEEKEIALLIQQHASSVFSDISSLEEAGAVNLLALDDMEVAIVANPMTGQSILRLPFNKDRFD